MLQKLRYWLRVFQDTCSRVKLYIMEQRAYPRCILSNRRFNPEIDITHLVDKQDVFVIRTFPPGCENLITEVGTLKDKAIPTKDIATLSMNMLGGAFLIRHCIYKVTGKASLRWPGKIDVFISDYLTDFEKLKGYCYFAYNVKDLHNAKIPFILTDNKDAKKLFRQLELESELEGKKLKSKTNGESIIAHTPSYLNYWHVELLVKDTDGKFIQRDEGNNCVRNTLCSHIYEHILSVKFIKDISKHSVAQINEVEYK